MTTFNLPDLGEGLAEAEIVRWHVNVGDTVIVDQPMLAVETAKAVVEVPAPFSGIVKTLHGQPGDVIATGAPLIEFDLGRAAVNGTAGGVRSPTQGGAATPPAQTALAAHTPAASRSNKSADTGTVVGNMPTSDDELIETAHAGGTYSANAPTNASTTGSANGTANGPADGSSGGQIRAAPAARALAKQLGIDLAGVIGTGRGGVLTVDDVLTRSGGVNSPSPAKVADTPSFADGEKLRGLRRAMAQSMSLARDNVANCSLFDDADLFRWRKGEDSTTRLLRAIAAGCKAEPALNAWFDGKNQSRRLLTRVDVGIAVDTADGLIVPVIRDVGNRTAAELRADINRLKKEARDRTVTPEDLRDVSFMLSNFGMMAGRYATPIVVPPTVAILGSGRLSRDVVAVNEAIETHLRMPLSLTFDHRCVTGGEAARFLAAVLRDLEKDN